MAKRPPRNYVNLKQDIMSALRKVWRFHDPGRKEAVRDWDGMCAKCGAETELPEVDHPYPVVPLDESKLDRPTIYEVDWTRRIKNMFVAADQYQLLCKPCHRKKTGRCILWKSSIRNMHSS